MKQIRIWKMIGLYIITLGIYGIVWLALRRNEMVERYKLRVPHWLWLVLPMLIPFVIVFPVAYIVYGITSQSSSTALILYGILLLGILVAGGISLWWMYRFGRAAQLITEGKVPLVWTMIYAIFLWPIMFFMLQYYFNRSSKSVNVKTSPQYKPSKNFVILSIALLVVTAPVTVLGTLQLPESLKEGASIQTGGKEIDSLLKETEQLAQDHKKCVDKLEADYPGDLTVEDEPAYTKAYDSCEEIRVKQHDKVDEYNKAVEKW